MANDILPARTHTTVATWLGLLGTHGVLPAEEPWRGQVSQLLEAAAVGNAESAAQAFEKALLDEVGIEAGEDLAEKVGGWFGDKATTSPTDGERSQMLQSMRRWTFQQGTPWLALLWQRDQSGRVGPHWVIVESVSDEVKLVDPDPWDGVDEDRDLDARDFMVLWELSGCAAVRVRRG